MMRFRSVAARRRCRVWALAIVACAAVAAPESPAAYAAEGPDSTGAGDPAWLPLPVEEIASPERLDDSSERGTAFSLRATVRGGRLSLRRVSAARRGPRLGVEFYSTGESLGVDATTVAFRSFGAGVELVGGRVAAGGPAPLFAEAIGFSRRTSRVPLARAGSPELEAPAGVTSPAVRGLGLRRAQSARSIVPALWFLAGRRAGDGILLRSGGATVSSRAGAYGLAVGAIGDQTIASFSGALGRAAGSIAGELLLTRRGVSGLMSFEGPSGPVRLRGRWRHRAEDARPSACELVAECGGRRARARLRVGGGASGAIGGSGRVEVEGRLAPRDAGPLTFRLGRSEVESFSSALGETARRERYAVLDATLVRARSRTLSFLVTRRERDAGGSTRAGSTLGGRLELAWRGRGRVEVLVEAARADRDGGAAWGSALYAGGSTALLTRTASGIESSARGSVRLGRWWLGGLVERREDEGGSRSPAGTIWIQRAFSRGPG